MDTHRQVHVRFGKGDGSLASATVVSTGDLKCVLRLGTSVSAEAGMPTVIFHHMDNRFFTQQGTVESIYRATPNETLVTIKCDSEPQPTENRENFRAVTAGRDLVANIGREGDCEVVNVSAQGLAVIMSNPPEVGRSQEISIQVQGKLARGRGVLRNAKFLSSQRYRCGFEVQDKELADALNRLCMAIQREQLRRLARSSP